MLILCQAQIKQGKEMKRVPGWAKFSVAERKFVELLGVPDVLTDQAWIALQGIAKDKKGNPLAEVYVPGSAFPWSETRWTLSSRGGVYLAGVAGAGGVITIRH